MSLKPIRPDPQGRVRYLLEKIDDIFNGPPDYPKEENPGLRHYARELCDGSGEIFWTDEVAMVAEMIRNQVITPLREVVALLESGPIRNEDSDGARS
jgi:hypothetical protein